MQKSKTSIPLQSSYVEQYRFKLSSNLTDCSLPEGIVYRRGHLMPFENIVKAESFTNIRVSTVLTAPPTDKKFSLGCAFDVRPKRTDCRLM